MQDGSQEESWKRSAIKIDNGVVHTRGNEGAQFRGFVWPLSEQS